MNNDKKSKEIIDIESILPDIIYQKGVSQINKTPFGEIEKVYQQRITLFHTFVQPTNQSQHIKAKKTNLKYGHQNKQ